MSINQTNMYDVDRHVAEIYDEFETQTDDVQLIRRLARERGRLHILEPFCGTGRILIPLALDGHELAGLDQASTMLDRARAKVTQLPDDVRARITLAQVDVTASPWPGDFDLVLLAGNCFYELASPEEQEGCVAAAAGALRPGGYVYVDNDHMEGVLDEGWRQPGEKTTAFPTRTCADGTSVYGTVETIWSDAPKRLVRFRRTVVITMPNGRTTSKEWVMQKHPVSMGEVKTWLEKHGFLIERTFGDHADNAYIPESPRAIFWARKRPRGQGPTQVRRDTNGAVPLVAGVQHAQEGAIVEAAESSSSIETSFRAALAHREAREVIRLYAMAWADEPAEHVVEQRASRLRQEVAKTDMAGNRLLLAKVQDQVVGVVRLTQDETAATQWYWSGLAVHPDYRRRGIAAALFNASLAYAQQCGAAALRSEAHADNEASIALHIRLGFRSEGRFTSPHDGDEKVAFCFSVQAERPPGNQA